MEHEVWINPSGWDRVIKITYPETFGQGFTGDASPLEYLNRLEIANESLGDDITVEGVVIERGKMRVVISQPTIVGTDPSPSDVAAFLEESGFEALRI